MIAALKRTYPASDERLREVLALHFHPECGSAYWLRRQEQLGGRVLDRVRSVADLWRLGPTPLDDLRRYPLRDFIPRALQGELHRFVIGETAGSSGAPRLTAYRDDEFQQAFVDPFLSVARATGFPRGASWLWIGPSGPHLIGKAVRELARQTGSLDPFSVDFDPRWAKRLPEGSLGRRRYLEHIVTQVLDVLERESVSVLFSTPPALAALVERMTDRQRESIAGVHYGGMRIASDELNRFRAAFPNAVHLSGYGNTLFGVLMEVSDEPRHSVDYFVPPGDRLRFHVIERAAADLAAQPGGDWPPRVMGLQQRGRVCFDRLDRSCLLVGVMERDEAERIAPNRGALGLGWTWGGLRDPGPPRDAAPELRLGIY
jgi:hypothetical protein